MSKSHRDNTAARKKRGPVAFKKRAERRKRDPLRDKCGICGWTSRVSAWTKNAGLCPHCNQRKNSNETHIPGG